MTGAHLHAQCAPAVSASAVDQLDQSFDERVETLFTHLTVRTLGLDPARHVIATHRLHPATERRKAYYDTAVWLPTEERLWACAKHAVRGGEVADMYERITPIARFWRPAKKGGRGGADDASALMDVALDVDLAGPGHAASNYPPTIDEAMAVITSVFPLEPSIIVASGGGIYPHFLLDEPWEFASAVQRDEAKLLVRGVRAAVAAAFAEHGWALDSTDLARIVRPPGTHNFKLDKQRPVTLVHLSDVRYSRADLGRYAVDVSRAPARPERDIDEPRYAPQVGPLDERQRGSVDKALRDECRRIVDAPDGKCHPTQLSASTKFGELVAGGVLDRSRAEEQLRKAITQRHGAAPNDDDKECIRWGLDVYGLLNPRSVPDTYYAARQMLAAIAESDAPLDTFDLYAESDDEVLRLALAPALETACKAAMARVFLIDGEDGLARFVARLRGA